LRSTIKEICARYEVSTGTAHRAIEVLAIAGLTVVSRRRRAIGTPK
jgi:DNA-binding GntR family transcriptional regulator